jgi:CheY-like chemotaxis protein
MAEEKKMAAKQSARAGGRVLVMDDDEIIRKMLTSMLNLVGYDVVAAADGAEAIKEYEQAAAKGRPFSAVIMDLTVPGGMGGKEAVSRLLEMDPAARVIVSSGYATDPIMVQHQPAAGNHYRRDHEKETPITAGQNGQPI